MDSYEPFIKLTLHGLIMKKTIISLSIISLLAGCGGGGGGSSTPDDKKPAPPAPKVDFPLKGSTFDAAKLKSTTLAIKKYQSSMIEEDTLLETKYEKSSYRPLEADEVAHDYILSELENNAQASSFFSISTSEYSDAQLTQLEDKEEFYGGLLANSKFITYIEGIALEQQSWELPDFVADGNFIEGQQNTYTVKFETKLKNLYPNQIQALLEDYGMWAKEYEGVSYCSSIEATRTFDFSGAKKENITINNKVIETVKANIIDKVSGTCYIGADGDSFEFGGYRNGDFTGLNVWLNPTFGIVKGIEKNDSKQEKYVVELVDFSMNQ